MLDAFPDDISDLDVVELVMLTYLGSKVALACGWSSKHAYTDGQQSTGILVLSDNLGHVLHQALLHTTHTHRQHSHTPYTQTHYTLGFMNTVLAGVYVDAQISGQEVEAWVKFLSPNLTVLLYVGMQARRQTFKKGVTNYLAKKVPGKQL